MSNQLDQAVDRLSSMADKVGGFGISTALLLTRGTFKDLAPSIEAHRFLICSCNPRWGRGVYRSDYLSSSCRGTTSSARKEPDC